MKPRTYSGRQKLCIECGSQFFVNASVHKFCSMPCHDIYNKRKARQAPRLPRPLRVARCLTCDKPFTALTRRKVYCSKTCRYGDKVEYHLNRCAMRKLALDLLGRPNATGLYDSQMKDRARIKAVREILKGQLI
jgi:hypothetical protein